jgi:protein-S-isoprenylcysteine O-methyltransferase Ste14
MNSETIFRILFILSFIFMTGIRVYYQSKIMHNNAKIEIKENCPSLIAGSIAALTTIVFGAEYIFSPGVFSFAYVLPYPDWLRWIGAFSLAGGILILGLSHYHLGKNFHSLVVSKENQELVETGPYRWIRHPIYTAYLLSYLGGGLLSGNFILTTVPVGMFAILVAIRMGNEEAVMRDRFGQEYNEVMKRTGRLVPRINPSNLLEELKYDLNFTKSHSLQPKWYKALKIWILLGFFIGYGYWFGILKAVLFFVVFMFLCLLLHLLYRVKTNKFKQSWLDFVVVEEDNEIKAKSIGKFYYSAIVFNTMIALIISQVFP